MYRDAMSCLNSDKNVRVRSIGFSQDNFESDTMKLETKNYFTTSSAFFLA